jgi:hypothetical protein
MPACRLFACLAAAITLAAIPLEASAQPAPDVDDLVARAGRYVVDYGQQMSLVIGVERYAQWMQNADQVRPLVRNLVSEFALVRTGDDWQGFRDVIELDGKPVGDRQDRLQTLFLESPATAVQSSRPIADASARYNLGPLQRNFNVPTTALFFLHPTNRARFSFKIDGEDAVAGSPVLKVRYREEKKPTIIRTSSGKDMPVKGTFWIDPRDGRVFRTTMELESDALMTGGNSRMADNRFEEAFQGSIRPAFGERRAKSTVSISVSYRTDSKLVILVPAEMVEIYESPYRSRFNDTESMSKVNCRAAYSDFRRFETSGRVVVK